MKPSEMTNDELADYIVNVIGGGIFTKYYAEAAARLRLKQQSDNYAAAMCLEEVGYKQIICDLRCRLKVVEEICEHEIASRQKTPARCEMCLEDSSAGEDCPYHKFCEDALVLNPECTKIIAHYKCAIDNEDMSDGCSPELCNYYKREKESEMAS